MIADQTKHVAVLLVNLYIPSSQSLKDKRMVLKSLKDRIRNKFNVSVAELDQDGKWQAATFGVSMIGNDQRYLDGCLQSLLTFIESHNGVEITDQEIDFF